MINKHFLLLLYYYCIILCYYCIINVIIIIIIIIKGAGAEGAASPGRARLRTSDGIGTPDPNPRNLAGCSF